MRDNKKRVCPVERAGSLDNHIRRWLQNPAKILGPYIKERMKVLDLGCGPGFFSDHDYSFPNKIIHRINR